MCFFQHHKRSPTEQCDICKLLRTTTQHSPYSNSKPIRASVRLPHVRAQARGFSHRCSGKGARRFVETPSTRPSRKFGSSSKRPTPRHSIPYTGHLLRTATGLVLVLCFYRNVSFLHAELRVWTHRQHPNEISSPDLIPSRRAHPASAGRTSVVFVADSIPVEVIGARGTSLKRASLGFCRSLLRCTSWWNLGKGRSGETRRECRVRVTWVRTLRENTPCGNGYG